MPDETTTTPPTTTPAATPTPAVPPAAPPDNKILRRLLERLFASLVNGPALNCKPHASRQRIDFTQLARLRDASPEAVLRQLLGEDRKAKVSAKVAAPRGKAAAKYGEPEVDDEELTAEQRAARQAFREQQGVFGKLRTIAEDAKTYENDTGVHVLQIGFPLLSLPPAGAVTRRVLAPLAFVSLAVNVKVGANPSVTMECRNDGADLVVPNVALLAWLEQQTGQPVGELESDDEGANPWAEIVAITRRICEQLHIEPPASLSGDAMPEDFALIAAPRSDDDDAEPKPRVLPAAVVGLYPMTNQGLLRDMQALVVGEQPATGPIENFIRVGVSLDAPKPDADVEPEVEKRTRDFAGERLITVADPCQARAVRQSRTSRALVIHGPPGSGKSQTIANIVGDHLARGERVLFVCEKRTALDVVKHRLDAMGLGSLCAVVHDPQRDQRELYRSIREQLDTLPETRSDASADGKLQRLDAEQQALHGELTAYHASLMNRPDKDTASFHELVGRWLDARVPEGVTLDDAAADVLDRREVERHAHAVADTLDRAATIGAKNPWQAHAGVALDAFLTTPIEQFRRAVDETQRAAEATDATIDAAIPPLPAKGDVIAVAKARATLAGAIESLRDEVPADVRARWAAAKRDDLVAAKQRIDAASPRAVEMTTIDADLAALVRDAAPTPQAIAEQTAVLENYQQSAGGLLGFLAFGAKKNAAAALAKYGLAVSPPNAARVVAFLAAVKARIALRDAVERVAPGTFATAALPDDAALLAVVRQHQATLGFLSDLHANAALADVAAPAAKAIAAADAPDEFLRGLRATGPRAEAVAALEKTLTHPLWSDASRKQFSTAARAGRPVGPTAAALAERFATLENVLRVRDGLAALPASLRPAVAALVEQGTPSADAVAVLRRHADANEIQRRLKADKLLTGVDGQRVQSSFARYRQLDASRKVLTIASVLHRWTSAQRDRLLSLTGQRMNTLGADLRRRLTLRGERAMRLRQVISVGEKIEGSDPLFDLRPVWMASPETVAQIFPRQERFDVVIFDEASQCRLEEAMPVLLRAKRVVIAGDPKQLPPTRFFEGAVAASDVEEAEDEQQLFEQQQGEIEDLLGAALNIEIDEAYLDVHYRSRNSDLIEFSNEHFYGSRLQAIPGHPRNRTPVAPIVLYRANGTYEKRENLAEAKQVCEIVAGLLKRAEPPSIGIACFNVSQRDLIVETLEERASEDAEFGRAFAAARERRGEGSFEGLFVKNLENVQGDERDHIIISTTYGPDAKGKFYRRFGPVGMAGGGRRLNVLVTRARAEVHLVTSIPETVYRALPPIPSGGTPGGAWLLFSYLNYAERLAGEYQTTQRILEQASPDDQASVTVRPAKHPSLFAKRFAERMREHHGVGSDVHWGNDGFCVDVALHHPKRPEDVTVGVQTDWTRFAQAADPVEWDVFRTGILENQGWTLTRVWSPHYFRDRHAVERRVADEARIAAEQPEPAAE